MNNFLNKLASLVKSVTVEPSSSPVSLRKAFIDALAKAGSGEGSRGGTVIGHDKSGKPIYESNGRKPYPGEEAHKMEPNAREQRKTFMPPEGTTPHYADTHSLRAYKNLMRIFKQKGIPFQGHITYNSKTDKVETLSEKGAAVVKQVLAEFSGKKTDPKEDN